MNALTPLQTARDAMKIADFLCQVPHCVQSEAAARAAAARVAQAQVEVANTAPNSLASSLLKIASASLRAFY